MSHSQGSTLHAAQVWAARKRLPTITTFSKKLNAIFGGGMRSTGVYICTGGPGAGKSNMAVAMAEAAIAAGCPTIYVSAELTPQLVMARLIGRRLGVEWLKVLDTEDPEQIAKGEEIANELGPMLWIIDSKQCGNYDDRVRQIRDAFLAAKRQQHFETFGQDLPPDQCFVPLLVIVDYIQDLANARLEKYQNPRLATAAVSREIRALADELFIPILVISSSSRSFYAAAEEQKNENLIASAKESGEVEYDSAAVFHIRRRDTGDVKALEVVVAKNRFGAAMQTVVFKFDPATGRLDELEDTADQLKYKAILEAVGQLIYLNPGKFKTVQAVAKELKLKSHDVLWAKQQFENGLYNGLKLITKEGAFYIVSPN